MADIMTTTVKDVIVIRSEDSDDSIVEVEVPKKPTPPLIQIEDEDEDMIFNVVQLNQRPLLATNLIPEEPSIIEIPVEPSISEIPIEPSVREMSEEPENLHTIISPDHWTPDMMKFYNDDWGDEDQFDVEKIQEKMNKTPSLWRISRKDEIPSCLRGRNIKCWNCNHRGHHFSECPEPPRITKCHMCGTEGHKSYSCPNSKCLNCGNQTREFVLSCRNCCNQANQICSRCHIIGHNFINCSDHWRLFHLTTGTTTVNIPNQSINKACTEIWCCNCGRQGHHQIYCNERKDCNGFSDTLPVVASYLLAFNKNHSTIKEKDAPGNHKGKNKHKNKSDKIPKLNPKNSAFRKQNTTMPNSINKIFRDVSKQKKKGRHRNRGKKFINGFFP